MEIEEKVPQDGQQAQPEMPKNKLTPARVKVIRGVYEFVDILVSALLVIFLVFTFLFRLVGVEGGSMEPTLQEGDRLLVSSLRFKPEYKDIVIITQPNIFHEPIVKRVIATGGQTVDIDFEQGIVYVDGEALDESAYLENGTTTQSSDYTYPLTVPKGHVFVLGDNRAVSNDSRSKDVGMVDERYIMGKAEWIVFPFQRFGKIT